MSLQPTQDTWSKQCFPLFCDSTANPAEEEFAAGKLFQHVQREEEGAQGGIGQTDQEQEINPDYFGGGGHRLQVRMRRQPEVRRLTIKSIDILTADYANAGMGAGLFGWKLLAGGQFYLTVCGARACCETGHLDNEADNWQRNKVLIYRCHNFLLSMTVFCSVFVCVL